MQPLAGVLSEHAERPPSYRAGPGVAGPGRAAHVGALSRSGQQRASAGVLRAAGASAPGGRGAAPGLKLTLDAEDGALHTVLCAAGYNLLWLLRAIAWPGITAVFLCLQLLAALLPGWRTTGAASSTPAAPAWSRP